MSLLLLLGCAPPVVDTASERLEPLTLLARVSLDLRGVRPSDDEIAMIEADPDALLDLEETFLHDARFGQRVRDLYAEIYLTRTESFPVTAADYGLDDEALFAESVGEEPLRVLSTVAEEDLPYTDIVVADWTMADETLASFLPVDYPADGSGWQKVHYTDGRPPAGVLATTGLWWRYTSTDSNMNRKRANAISRLLLCNNYLDHDITFDRDLDLLDADAVQNAVETNAACMSCHVSLDPIASNLYGFWWYNQNSAMEARLYHPERERLWEDTTGTPPSWYGQPESGLQELTRYIAEDPRFPSCAVEQVMTLLLRRDLTLEDTEAENQHRQDFLDGGLTLRALFRSVVQDPSYVAAPGGLDGEDAPGASSWKMTTPDLLASEVEDLTGFDWTSDGARMLATDNVGLRDLAGGVDGQTTTAAATSPNATVALVLERLAEGAATYAVSQEGGEDPADRRLFTEIDFKETPTIGRDAMVAQIQALHRRVLSQEIAEDSDAVSDELALWQDIYDATGSPQAAWSGLLTALMRDPDFLFY